MAPLLVNVLSVGPLAGGASITLPHGLNYDSTGVIPTQVICDRASPIAVTGTTTSTVTFTNGSAGAASANFRCEYDHSIHAVGATPIAWQGYVPGAGGGAGVYGVFSDSTDQALTPNVPLAVQLDTVELAGGVTVVNDPITLRPTRITVPVSGIYSLDVSPQMLHTGGGGVTITFWARIDGVNVDRTGTSFEMGNNNNRTCPFLQIEVALNAGQYFEWIFMSTGTNTSLEQFPAVAGPPAVPAIPSVIVNCKRLFDLP